jgi:glycine/D-amino acid oxidase-like deaminating enzyme
MTPLHVAVVGAGAFGGWTALHLLRRGARVTLIDAWGAGNSRSSSGGETRIIRGAYGPDRLYVDWTARSFTLWKEAEQRWGRRLYRRTGVLWMVGEDDSYVRASLPFLRDAGLAVEEISPEGAGKRFPQIDFAGAQGVFFEPEAGYLLARQACQAVAEAVVAEGGEMRLAAGAPDAFQDGALRGLELTDGSTLRADHYLFACGPWLGGLFPDVIGDHLLRVTRQEVFFFGLPPGDPWFHEDRCPTWVDLSGERIFYGMPGNENRGFKVADDTRGAPFDPTFEERLVTPALLEAAREAMDLRFPGMAGQPVVETRVCQYENSPDGHLLFGRHPTAGNVWLLGGGSGHGFKLAPALGEYAARILVEDGTPDPLFRLDRPGHAEGAVRTQFER